MIVILFRSLSNNKQLLLLFLFFANNLSCKYLQPLYNWNKFVESYKLQEFFIIRVDILDPDGPLVISRPKFSFCSASLLYTDVCLYEYLCVAEYVARKDFSYFSVYVCQYHQQCFPKFKYTIRACMYVNVVSMYAYACMYVVVACSNL